MGRERNWIDIQSGLKESKALSPEQKAREEAIKALKLKADNGDKKAQEDYNQIMRLIGGIEIKF